jgi:recombination protein RecR
MYGEAVTRLIDEFARLPGIGKKSAERLAYHVLRVSRTEALGLADAIRSVKENVQHCRTCFHLAEGEACAICRDARRDTSQLCIVEQPRDLLAIEQAGTYRGLYHVLLGRISPLEGVGPEQLTIDPLMERVQKGHFQEIIMGTNPTLEGDGTALYISNLLSELPARPRITRLARGITSGSVLEFANKEMLADALAGRQDFS